MNRTGDLSDFSLMPSKYLFLLHVTFCWIYFSVYHKTPDSPIPELICEQYSSNLYHTHFPNM